MTIKNNLSEDNIWTRFSNAGHGVEPDLGKGGGDIERHFLTFSRR